MQETQEMQVWSLSHEDPLSKKWQPTPELLPGKFHRQRSLQLQFMGLQKVGYDWATVLLAGMYPLCVWLKKKKIVFICLAAPGLSWGMQDLVPKPGPELQPLHWGQGVSAPNHWTNHQEVLVCVFRLTNQTGTGGIRGWRNRWMWSTYLSLDTSGPNQAEELSWWCYMWVRACMLSLFSRVWLFATLWTIASQAPLSMGLSKQEYWGG